MKLMKTRSKKAKKSNYTKDCEEQPKEIPDQCKKKSLKPVCVMQDSFVCTYEPEEICRDKEKQHCHKVGRAVHEDISQGISFGPEEINAMVLIKRKETAEANLERKFTHAVVTVPAYFNDDQKQVTKDTGMIASLTAMRTINEPITAAIAYEMDKKVSENNTFVFDRRGETYDVSFVITENEVLEVARANGDTHLGEEDDSVSWSISSSATRKERPSDLSLMFKRSKWTFARLMPTGIT